MNFLLNAEASEMTFFEKLSDIFSNFHPIWSTLDILLLGVVFFFASRFLKSKKTVAIIIGVVFCLVILVVSGPGLLNLPAVHGVFAALASGGPIILIILFQPEIRDALERLGTGSINSVMTFSDRKKKKELYFNVIENICSAVKELSGECTGALIVVERTTRLSDVIGGGVQINADVSAALLRNLFYNKAPLHDGAVVISEGRVAAAGCFLPLTRRTDLNSDLGTRHRAALGMSESSDAITIVVSEETGIISVAYDYSLVRGLTADELKAFLLENLLKSTINVSES